MRKGWTLEFRNMSGPQLSAAGEMPKVKEIDMEKVLVIDTSVLVNLFKSEVNLRGARDKP